MISWLDLDGCPLHVTKWWQFLYRALGLDADSSENADAVVEQMLNNQIILMSSFEEKLL